MKSLITKYYPFLINAYTLLILYMLFFAYNRGDSETARYFIRPYPFESINYLLNVQMSKAELYKNIFGNIFAFVPYGFLGIMYPKLNRYIYLLLVFFIAINYLEFCQYFFKRGYAELDDVLLNCFGTTLGFLLYKLIFRGKTTTKV